MERIIPRALFLITLILFLFVNLNNINNPILEMHSFRQTQTALSAFYLADGFRLDYLTPVVGYPWSIPFEFPLFQWVVINTSNLFQLPLTSSGRLISLVFSLLCLIPINGLIIRSGMKSSESLYMQSLFLSSPIYIFWAGTFMIESTALFFILSFLFFAYKIYQKKENNYDFIFATLFLTLAFLQKATTALPIFCLCIFLFTIKTNGYKYFYKPMFIKNNYKLLITFGLPLIIGVCWVNFTDFIKEQNTIGYYLTSSALWNFNWGDLSTRFSTTLWHDVVIKRSIFQSSAHYLSAIIILFSLFIKNKFFLKEKTIISLIAFTLAFLFFPKLHVIHNYYQYANTIFYLFSLFFATQNIIISYSLYRIDKLRNPVNLFEKFFFLLNIKNILFPLIVILSMINYYNSNYHFKKNNIITIENNRTLILADFIKKNSPIDKPIVIYGYQWNSELAFYAERKSLSLPFGKWDIESIENLDKFLPEASPSIIINCPNPNFEDIDKKIINKYNIQPIHLAGCSIFLLNDNEL